MSECRWCRSSRHSSNNCPIRNLLKFLNGESFEGKLPDLVSVTNEKSLIDTVEEAHAIQHITRKKVSE
jgi:hypothetical protein